MVIPTKIQLESSSYCQLKCPYCPTASTEIHHSAIGRGFLKLDDFKRLLDMNPLVKEVELSNYGEIFLNPDLLKIIQYAYERRVVLSADNGVNLNNVKESVLEGLVKYKFRSMSCSIDGASNQTYKLYRVRGNFEAVIKNIEKINLYKEKYQSEYPLLNWQFIVFGHNEHEIPLAREMAHYLGMTFQLKLSWNSNFSPVRHHEFIRKEVGAASQEEYKQKHGVNYLQGLCYQLWDAPQINWDGKVLGCCVNFWGDFGGNAFKEELLHILNNEKIKYARKMLLGKRASRPDIPCSTCSRYLDMRADGRWLKRGPLFLSYRALKFVYRTLGMLRLRQKLRNLRRGMAV